MRLALLLEPNDAAALSRLTLDGAPRRERTRARILRIDWYDDGRFSLAARGQALVAEARQWRLESLDPASEAPSPSGATMAALGVSLPQSVGAVATLAGRRTAMQFETKHGAVGINLYHGALRAGSTTQPVCRAELEGAEAAVEHAALAIITRTRATLAARGLGEDALRIAGAVLPAPGRGPATVPGEPGVSVADAFSRIVLLLTLTLLQWAPEAITQPERPVPVHQMRVAVRRARSAVAIFRTALACPAVEGFDAGLRALGKALAPARDWDVFATETLPAVAAAFPDDARLTRLQRAAERQRQDHHAALAEYLRGPAFRTLTLQAMLIAIGQHWRDGLAAPAPGDHGLRGFADAVMRKRWKRLLSAGDGLEDHPVEALHDLRLRAKRARYAAEMFAPLYPTKAVARHIRRLARLQEELGVLNDRVVAAALLQALPGGAGRHDFAAGVVLGFSAASAVPARKRIQKAWQKCRRGDDFWH